MIAGLYLIMLKTEKCWDLMHYDAHALGGYPYFFGTNAYIH